MHRDYHRWDSPRLGRAMELLWFGHAGRPVLVFPTSVGRFYQNEDFGLVGGIADRIDAGAAQLCCVDSVDAESWYNRGAHPAARVLRHDQYDAYLAAEVVPFVRSRSGREDLVAYGASFGGYHAVNFAFRHPEMVSRVVAFSGLFDVHRFLDGHWDDLCYFHCPTAYVANYPPEWVEKVGRIGIVVATGEHDHLASENRAFADLLRSKGIPVHAEIWPGVFGHDWPWWIENLRRFVP
jgi:esterase/lipase superfamily enzyme